MFPFPPYVYGNQAAMGGAVIDSNTNLAVFKIDGVTVIDGGTVNKPFGTSSVVVVATPQNPAASAGAPTGDTGLVTGDNAVSVLVTASDGITTRLYSVTVHVLTAGVAEVTLFSNFKTGFALNVGGGNPGDYVVISSASVRFCAWAHINGTLQPDASAAGATIYGPVEVGEGDDDTTVANSFASVINTILVSAVPASSQVTVTDAAVGTRVDAVNGGACASVSITTQGEDPS